MREISKAEQTLRAEPFCGGRDSWEIIFSVLAPYRYESRFILIYLIWPVSHSLVLEPRIAWDAEIRVNILDPYLHV